MSNSNKDGFAAAWARFMAGDMSNMRCTKCGKSDACGCWEQCSCGWTAEAGRPCCNPDTTMCSTKVKYGVGNGKTRRRQPKGRGKS